MTVILRDCQDKLQIMTVILRDCHTFQSNFAATVIKIDQFRRCPIQTFWHLKFASLARLSSDKSNGTSQNSSRFDSSGSNKPIERSPAALGPLLRVPLSLDAEPVSPLKYSDAEERVNRHVVEA